MASIPPLNNPFKILLVEDEPSVRFLMNEVLSERGFEVRDAALGRDALRQLSSADGFHLMIVDLGLPDMTGEEVVRKARHMMPDVAVLFVTGQIADDVRFPLDATTDVLAKPFSLSQLVEAVHRLLANAPAA